MRSKLNMTLLNLYDSSVFDFMRGTNNTHHFHNQFLKKNWILYAQNERRLSVDPARIKRKPA